MHSDDFFTQIPKRVLSFDHHQIQQPLMTIIFLPNIHFSGSAVTANSLTGSCAQLIVNFIMQFSSVPAVPAAANSLYPYMTVRVLE
jgi:hypothetical protein